VPPETTVVHVYVDSSCFRRESAWSEGALKRLQELVRQSVAKVYVHEIVAQEVATGLLESLQSAGQKLKEVRRALSWLSERERQEAFQSEEKLRELMASAEAQLADELQARLRELNAEIVPMSLTATQEMWRRYFAGEVPFKGRKSRDDLPDGAILAAALDLAVRLGEEPLHVVVADKRLRDACPPNLHTHEKLGAFTSCEAVRNALRTRAEDRGEGVSGDELAVWAEKVRRCVADAHGLVVRVVSGGVSEELPGTHVFSPYFPSDGNDAAVDMVGHVEDLTIDFNGMDFISRTEMTAPFIAELGESRVTLYVDRREAEDIEDDEQPFALSITDSDWSENLVEAEATVSLKIAGQLRLELEEDEYETLRFVTGGVEYIADVDVVDPT
jgi:hypothetical protein